MPIMLQRTVHDSSAYVQPATVLSLIIMYVRTPFCFRRCKRRSCAGIEPAASAEWGIISSSESRQPIGTTVPDLFAMLLVLWLQSQLDVHRD